MAASRNNPWRTWLILAVVAGAGYWGYRQWKAKSANQSSAPTEFRTNRVTRGDITQSVTANGALNPVKIVTVGSQISGIITELAVDFNSLVKEGEVLAKIDPATYERQYARAEADLASAKASQALAQFNQKQARQLFDQRLISQTEFEQSDVALLQADATVKMREAALAEAKVGLDRTVIYAPISGVVISRRVEAGQTVAASFNTPELFQIANDLTQMQIEAAVSEADVGGVQEGQRVTFLVDAFPNRQFSGKVRQVRFAPTTNQNVVSYTTVVDVKNLDRKLRPGMTANASIITAERTNVIRVPNSALRFRPPEGAVIGSTNDVVAKSAGTNAPSSRPEGLPIPPWVAEGRRPTDEERKKFDETLTPEQREQMRVMRERMRAQMSQGGGPGGGGGMMAFGGGGAAASTADSPGIRTVYLIDSTASQPGKPVLQAVSVRTGISDGANTEIVEGLKEGEVVVTGVVVAETTATATSTTARPGSPLGGSPFGGPRMR
ncbi:MAG: efflux RND transporter periplasmic adaptor subunit [Verrucomicrobia bacterium]|nr:efflux RND transporter periplasmic adaptor subunit [Verrucomicrobiota bacterium]